MDNNIKTNINTYGLTVDEDKYQIGIKDEDTSINAIEIKNGVFRNLYLQNGVTVDSNDDITTNHIIPTEWQDNTVLFAKFNGSLNAGNVDISVSGLSEITLKKREVGENDWIQVLEKTNIDKDDKSTYNISYDDKYCANDKYYEYAIFCIEYGLPKSVYVSKSVKSSFRGLVLATKDAVYNALLNYSVKPQLNSPTVTQVTLQNKYPFVTKTSANEYYTGSAQGCFVELINCEFDFDNPYPHNQELESFLIKGYPMVMKLDDGRCWLVAVTDSMSVNNDMHDKLLITTFNWAEIGDVNSYDDLKRNGLV